MNTLLLGIDAGNHSAKVAGAYGLDTSKTAICGWFEQDVVEVFGDDDTEFEIGGRKGFAGSIAENEDEFGGGSMYGDTKAHEDTKIRVLLAAHRYINKHCPQYYKIKIVVGQPIKSHKESEKQLIKDMLIGRHSFTVNGVDSVIDILGCEVATEGGGAFWANPEEGEIRLLDVGSGTINAITIKNSKIINNRSSTFPFGAETVRNKSDYQTMARGIIQNLTKLGWHRNDRVVMCGGIAVELHPHIAEHFTKSEVMNPAFQYRNGVTIAHPVYSNSIGFYEIAKGVYGD